MFTNERILVGTIVPFVRACNTNREYPLTYGVKQVRAQGASMNGDSTYKVGYEGGWELMAFFTHAVVEKTAKDRRDRYS